MTGTPIQNTVEDLGSLIRFLRVPCLSDIYSFRKHISGVPKKKLRHPEPNVKNLKLLLESICLRRSKAILSLPESRELTYELSFSKAEQRAYDDLTEACKKLISASANKCRTSQSSHPMLRALLRLRMFCNIGFEIGKKRVGYEPDEIISLFQQIQSACCFSCGADIVVLEETDVYERSRLSHCDRLVCGECASRLQERSSEAGTVCPFCDTKCSHGVLLSPENASFCSNSNECSTGLMKSDQGWPTKLLAVKDNLVKHLESDKRLAPSFSDLFIPHCGTDSSNKVLCFHSGDKASMFSVAFWQNMVSITTGWMEHFDQISERKSSRTSAPKIRKGFC